MARRHAHPALPVKSRRVALLQPPWMRRPSTPAVQAQAAWQRCLRLDSPPRRTTATNNMARRLPRRRRRHNSTPKVFLPLLRRPCWVCRGSRTALWCPNRLSPATPRTRSSYVVVAAHPHDAQSAVSTSRRQLGSPPTVSRSGMVTPAPCPNTTTNSTVRPKQRDCELVARRQQRGTRAVMVAAAQPPWKSTRSTDASLARAHQQNGIPVWMPCTTMMLLPLLPTGAVSRRPALCSMRERMTWQSALLRCTPSPPGSCSCGTRGFGRVGCCRRTSVCHQHNPLLPRTTPCTIHRRGIGCKPQVRAHVASRAGQSCGWSVRL